MQLFLVSLRLSILTRYMLENVHVYISFNYFVKYLSDLYEIAVRVTEMQICSSRLQYCMR